MTYKITIVLVIGLIGEAWLCCIHDIMVLTLVQCLQSHRRFDSGKTFLKKRAVYPSFHSPHYA